MPRVIAITGASAGVGRATVLAFARAARLLATLWALAGCNGAGTDAEGVARVDAASPHTIDTIFLVVMENKNWARPAPDPVVLDNPSAPYINSLLPFAAHAEAYTNPPGEHPSALDYVWLEGGQDFGLTTDADPADAPIDSPDHLVNLLDDAGVSWRAYVEGISVGACRRTSAGTYAARHVPFLYFTDMTAKRCRRHVVPYAQLAADLAAGTAPRYAFIVPDLCDDMHGAPGCPADDMATGDAWLAANLPPMFASDAYRAGRAAIFLLWDESVNGDHPIGMIVLSKHARRGYASKQPLDHSATLRTLEEVFDVGPMLGAAADAPSLDDLFDAPP